jgi:hypothetical protein
MKKRLLISIVTTAIFVTASIVGADVGKRVDRASRDKRSAPGKDINSFAKAETSRARVYRSPGAFRKIVLSPNDTEAINMARSSGAIEVGSYDSFKLFIIEQSSFDASNEALNLAASQTESASASSRLIVRDDYNVLLLRSGAIDTTDEAAPGTFVGLGHKADFDSSRLVRRTKEQRSDSPLRLVQFVGPVKSEWINQLRANGMEIIAYVPNNAYLVRASSGSIERLISAAVRDYARGRGVIQWEGPFTEDYKIHPSLASQMKNKSKGEVAIAIQIAGAGGNDLASAKAMASSLIGDAYKVVNFTNLKMRVDISRLGQIASLPGVVNIEPWSEPQLFDERAGQIVAGDLIEEGKRPRAPGYMAWLNAHNMNVPLNFAIDVTDTGIDRGSTQAANLHPDFLDANGQSRIIYARDYTTDLDGSDTGGHGTINLSIAGGSNMGSQSGLSDADGFRYGLGIAPFVKLGSSKIFAANGFFGLNQPFSNIIIDAYHDGARISSNSWGAGRNEYTLDAQEYDTRVRDALPAEPGNQEMTIVFATGNSGPNRFVSSPATAKNVIAVGASEGVRAGGEDGCGVKNEDADSVLDMAFFSSGGPLNDGRPGTNIVAPGSHIQGAATQHADFEGDSVCGEDLGKPFFPKDQTLYTWSSGTSHSTPQVAGAAALARHYFLSRGQEPSAALIRAFLFNTTTYMTGTGAGGDLPHPSQGWGLLNLGRAFDNASRIFVDQTHTFTDSGQEFVITGEVTNSSLPFRVTLSWTDAPGLSAFASWVNDLDLEITINGEVYRGNNLVGQTSEPGGEPDIRNNTEAIWLPAGVTGPFALRVRASNIAGDGVPGNADLADQDFAIAIYNAERKDAAVPIFSNLSVSGGGNNIADPGETVSMTVSLGDASPIALSGARGTITSATAGVNVTTGTADFPNIAPGSTGENLTAFSFTISNSFACGGVIDFVIEITSGGSTAKIPFVVKTGSAEAVEAFSDDIESGESKWIHGSLVKKKKQRVDTWALSTRRFRSGGNSWFTPNPAKLTDSNLDTLPITLPSNGRDLRLVFYHTFELEGNFDGGVIEISTDGKTFTDLEEKILEGEYTGLLREAFSNNPLRGRRAWTGGRFGTFQKVVVDLSSFSGQTVIIRFRMGADKTVAGSGWFVDDVTVGGERVTCSTPAP